MPSRATPPPELLADKIDPLLSTYTWLGAKSSKQGG
jgi:hypothetical protein